MENPARVAPDGIRWQYEWAANGMLKSVTRPDKREVTLELHHTNTPQRIGGDGVHDASNLSIVNPWEHEIIDPYRHVGSDLDFVVRGVDIW